MADKKHIHPENLKILSGKFLLTDLDVAMTFLDVAETTTDTEHAKRSRLDARKAYDTVTGLLSKLDSEVAYLDEIKEKMRALKARLMAAGQWF
jgi:hypothetical protein